MEHTPDFRISRSFKIEDDLRKTEGLLCIEWNIANYKSLLLEKPVGLMTSPTFQMNGVRWHLSLRHAAEELFFNLECESEREQHSITYLITIESKRRIYLSFLRKKLLDESESFVPDYVIDDFFRELMIDDNLRVFYIVFPEVEQRASEAISKDVTREVETQSNTIRHEGTSETTENVISPSLKTGSVEDIKIASGSGIVGNFRLTKGLLCIEWNIKNYKSLSGEKGLKLLTSPSFQMRGASNLVLQFTAEENVIIFLHLSEYESGKRHSITCLMTIQVSKHEMYHSILKTVLFNGSGEIAAVASFSIPSIHDLDYLRVLCMVFPEMKEQTSEATSEETSVAPTSVDCGAKGVEMHSNMSDEGIDILASNMKDLFLKEENYDFVIKVKDRDFRVHKAILAARSPVLSAMLQHDMAEKNSATTNLDDCESGVFELFLLYLYSGRVEELSWSNATHLYTLGDKYDMPHLRKECLRFMEGNLSIEAFCDAIALAVKHNESTLVKCAEEFFLTNVKSILVTNKWQLLMKENPVICNELFLKCYK